MKDLKCILECVPKRRRFLGLILHSVVIGVAWIAIEGEAVWAQRKSKAPPAPVERSYPMGYALALAAAGAAVFVVGRPHARVQESRPDDRDYP